MNNSPLKNFGFSYKFDDKECSFNVVARDKEEAMSRLRSMAAAEYVGELHEEVGVVELAI